MRSIDCYIVRSLNRWIVRSLDCYNPGQNYLRKFSPSCPLSYATKLFRKRRLCGKKTPSPNINVASHKRPGIRLSFECTTTLLSGEGGEGRTGTATMFRKMLSKYTIFSTVLSKIVYKVIRVFWQEYLQGQNKNMLIKSTLQKLF